MKTTFYIFRHGQTDWNINKRLQGKTDIPLNELGLKQASKLADHMKKLPLEMIVSSPLIRAQKTAELVNQYHNLEIEYDLGLRELDFGEAEGLTVIDAQEKYGADLWNNFIKHDDESNKFCFPGGEPKGLALERGLSMLKRLSENRHEHIALSSHGGILRLLIHSFLPEGTEPIQISNCILYKIEYEDQEVNISGPIWSL